MHSRCNCPHTSAIPMLPSAIPNYHTDTHVNMNCLHGWENRFIIYTSQCKVAPFGPCPCLDPMLHSVWTPYFDFRLIQLFWKSYTYYITCTVIIIQKPHLDPTHNPSGPHVWALDFLHLHHLAFGLLHLLTAHVQLLLYRLACFAGIAG